MSSTEEKPDPIIFGDESLSDVTLVVDNQEFKSNKTFLACRSDVFKAMFFGLFKESKEDRVEIKDVSAENFRRFLEIIYTGKTSDPLKFLELPFNDDEHVTIRFQEGEVSTDEHFVYAPSYEKLFYNFWNDTREILNIADRFNLPPMVKDYFEPIITTSIRLCKADMCCQCFNYLIFAILNGMNVSKCKKKHPMSQYKKWVDYADEEPFPDIHKKATKTLFKYLY